MVNALKEKCSGDSKPARMPTPWLSLTTKYDFTHKNSFGPCSKSIQLHQFENQYEMNRFPIDRKV